MARAWYVLEYSLLWVLLAAMFMIPVRHTAVGRPNNLL